MMPDRKSRFALNLHWPIAALVLAALASGYALTRPGAFSAGLLQAHLALGASAGVLALARVLIWAAAGAPPPVFAARSRFEAGLAKTVHALLRLVPLLLLASGAGMIALSGAIGAVISGELSDLAPFRDLPPRGLHHAAAILLAALVGLHVIAALWHRLRAPGLRAG
ncbi:MAG: hypothetical protein Tsb0019_00630 [Roseibium sp.]